MRVVADLVPPGVDAPDEFGVPAGGDTGDEEGGSHLLGAKHVQDAGHADKRAERLVTHHVGVRGVPAPLGEHA